MKFYITLINNQNGILFDESITLPVSMEITWEDFVNLRPVKELLSSYVNCEIVDITPEGMPDKFTEAETLDNILEHQGMKKTRNAQGLSVYEELESD